MPGYLELVGLHGLALEGIQAGSSGHAAVESDDAMYNVVVTKVTIVS